MCKIKVKSIKLKTQWVVYIVIYLAERCNLKDELSKGFFCLFGFTVGLGVFVTFTYCAFIIGFFPSDLTTGDSILFIFVSIWFGLLYSIWLGLGFLTAWGVSYPWLTETGKKDDKISRATVFISGAICFIALVIFSIYTGDYGFLLASIVCGSVIVIVVECWAPSQDGVDSHDRSVRNTKRFWVGLSAIFVFPLLSVTTISNIANSSFKVFGINQVGVSVVLSEENYRILSKIIPEICGDDESCNARSYSDMVFHDVNILWHGVGDKSLIVFPISSTDKPNYSVRVELASSGVNVFFVAKDGS